MSIVKELREELMLEEGPDGRAPGSPANPRKHAATAKDITRLGIPKRHLFDAKKTPKKYQRRRRTSTTKAAFWCSLLIFGDYHQT